MAKSAFNILKKSSSTVIILRLVFLSVIGIEIAAFYFDNIFVTAQLFTLALGAIVIGSITALIDSDDVDAETVERMQPKDAYIMPVMGSITLCTMYVVIKYAPQWIISIAVRAVFIFVGTLAIDTMIVQLFELFAFMFGPIVQYITIPVGMLISGEKQIYGDTLTIPTIWFTFKTVPPPKKNNGNQQFTLMTYGSFLSLIAALICAIVWYQTDHWLLNNLIGVSLCIQAISFINPGSFFTASVLLVLLFFYDIFWVFGTDVMVTVAKGLNAPIKLIFPCPAVMEKPSMLGLGDIVLPGIYIALLLRFDIARRYGAAGVAAAAAVDNNGDASNDGSDSDSLLTKKYFISAMVGYTVAMAVCLYIMYAYEHAQPALLYLVPGVLIVPMVVALVSGEIKQLWNYDEEPEKSNAKKD